MNFSKATFKLQLYKHLLALFAQRKTPQYEYIFLLCGNAIS